MRTAILALGLAGLAAGCSGTGDAAGEPDEPIPPGQPAPAFTLKGLDGKEISLASLRGKAVLINFWGVG